MINYNQARNNRPFSAAEIAAAEAQAKKVEMTVSNQEAVAMEYEEYLADMEASNGPSAADLAELEALNAKEEVASAPVVKTKKVIKPIKRVKTMTKSTSVKTTVIKSNTEVTTMTPAQIKSVQTFASKGIKANFSTGTLNDRVVRNYAIIRIAKDGKIKSETLINRNQLMNLVAKSLSGKTASQANGLVFKSLEQALFVESKGYGNPEAQTDLPLDVDVANANRAYVLEDKFGTLVPVGLDGKTIARLVAQTDLAICPDKQVKKSVLIGDGAIAAGVYRDGKTLRSINPIDDFTKGINRANAGFAGKADSDRRVVQNLEYEAEGGNFTKEGVAVKAIFVPGLAVLAQGMISLNEGVSFDYSTPVNFTRKFEVETIGVELVSMDVPSVLVKGSEVVVNEVVIYSHSDNTELVNVAVAPSYDADEEVWSFEFTATTQATAKTNFKSRDFGNKGMTHNNGVTVAERNDWEMLFTSESIKTAEALRTMFCQANPGHRVSITGDLLDANGNVVSDKDINNWYANNGQQFTVSTPVCSSNVADLKAATAGKVQFVVKNGVTYAVQSVFGICADYLINVEVSTADEIAGINTSEANATAIHKLVNSTLARKLS